MKTLLLMRHAKSDWDHPDLSDHDRPLNPRGLRNAPLMGNYMSENNLLPDVCLTSTAIRSKRTARLALEAMQLDIETLEIPELYGFGSGQEIRQAIASHGSTSTTLFLVAHNPSVQGFTLSSCETGSPQALTDVSRKYPTCALAHITFQMDNWSMLHQTKGHLESFTTPKSLG